MNTLTEPFLENLPLSRRTQHLSASLVREILAVAQQPNMISFAGGLPAVSHMPDLGSYHVPSSMNQYGESQGEPFMRATIAGHLQTLGLRTEPARIMVTTGSQQGIDLVSKLFIDEGTVVGVECPTYLAATQCFRFFGAQFLELDLTSATFDLPTLRQQLLAQRPAFLYLIPTFQNPTGACYSQAQRMALAALLDELNICLVEDEPYRDLVYDEVDRTPICHYLQRAPWIYLGSFSKIAIPALRIGYLACDPRLYTPLLRLKQASDLHSNRWAQWLLNEFVQSDDYANHITQLCSHYRQQRDLMQAALQQHMGELGEWAIPAGGLFFWIHIKERKDKPINTLDLLQRALDQGVAFMPGDPFFANAHSRYAALRLNFSHSSAAQIEQGVATLAQLLQTEHS